MTNATKSILIIDDEEHFAQVLSRSLNRNGFTTSYALNHTDAIELIKQQAFDWVSLDLRLGQESGLKIITEIKTLLPQARVVILTGFASIPTAVEAIKLGAFNYLHKPATVKELISAFIDDPENSELVLEETPMSVERLEWEHIQRVLHENNDNISSTARALGMHRRTLQRKLQKHPTRH